jgi:regulator of replication initiation timing
MSEPEGMPLDLNDQVQTIARLVNKLINDVSYLRAKYSELHTDTEYLGLALNKLKAKGDEKR